MERTPKQKMRSQTKHAHTVDNYTWARKQRNYPNTQQISLSATKQLPHTSKQQTYSTNNLTAPSNTQKAKKPRIVDRNISKLNTTYIQLTKAPRGNQKQQDQQLNRP